MLLSHQRFSNLRRSGYGNLEMIVRVIISDDFEQVGVKGPKLKINLVF